MRAPCVIRWPGHIKPGTSLKQMFASLDWVPTLVEIAGGPKGDGTEEADQDGQVPRHRQDNAGWRSPARLSRGKVEKSARDYFFYYRGRAFGGALQELEILLHHGAFGQSRRRFDPGRDLSLEPCRQHQARSFRNGNRGRRKGAMFGSAAHWLVLLRLIFTTGTCCPSASSCG